MAPALWCRLLLVNEGIRSLNRDARNFWWYIKIVLYPHRREIDRDPPRFAFVPALKTLSRMQRGQPRVTTMFRRHRETRRSRDPRGVEAAIGGISSDAAAADSAVTGPGWLTDLGTTGDAFASDGRSPGLKDPVPLSAADLARGQRFPWEFGVMEGERRAGMFASPGAKAEDDNRGSSVTVNRRRYLVSGARDCRSGHWLMCASIRGRILGQMVARKTVCIRRWAATVGRAAGRAVSSPIRRACPAKPEVTAAKLVAGYFHAIHRGRQLEMEQP